MASALKYLGKLIGGTYLAGAIAMFSFVMYANFQDGDITRVFTQPLDFLCALGLALFLAAIWPVALYFAYMLTTHH